LPSECEEYGFRDGARTRVVSRVTIERLDGPQRLAYLPAEEEPVASGCTLRWPSTNGVRPGQYPPQATTLDYVVAAAGG
jgi:hypothetical protein